MSDVLPAASVIWQPRVHTFWVTAIAKITFDISPGEMRLSNTQEPITFADSFWNDDDRRSLTAATDLVPSKSRCDVVVVGQAFAPGATPVRSLVARLGFESIDKKIELVMDRALSGDGTVFQGQRFARMPLAYERAAGGPGTFNPVGVRQGARDPYGRTPLPNIVSVGWGDDMTGPFDPVGFGPLSATWPERVRHLGGRPAPQLDKLHAEPMAEGFDFGFFNVAPPDQQCDDLPDDGALLLENLHREHPVLGTRLPGLKPRVIVERRGGQERPKLRADTLWIDTDRALVTVTYRGHFPIDHAGESFRVVAELDKSAPSWKTQEHSVAIAGTCAKEVTQYLEQVDASLAPLDRETMVDQAEKPAPKALERESTSSPSSVAAAGLPFQSAARRSGLPFGAKSKTADPPPLEPAGFKWPSSKGATLIATSPVAIPVLPNQMPEPSASGIAAMPVSAPPPHAAAGSPALASAPAFVAPTFSAPTFGSAPPPAFSADGFRPSEPKTTAPVAGSTLSALGALSSPTAPPQHASAAALSGLVDASNAAADPRQPDRIPTARVIEGDVLHLIWFNPEVAPRVRRNPEWKKLLDKLEQGAFDPEIDEGSLAEDPADLEDRREIYEVIARGAPSGQDSVDRALLDAVRADGRFAPRVLLLVGEVRFDFDEIEQLKATIATALPFATGDEPLKKHTDGATAFLGAPGLVASPEVASAMSQRIREAFLESDRLVGPTFLDDQVERALLDRRSFQKRNVFGEPHIRGQFFFSGSSTGIPLYLPEPMGKKLPLFRRLRIRTLAEAHFQADQYESHAAALKAVAVARIVR
jgi:hypothetical protein